MAGGLTYSIRAAALHYGLSRDTLRAAISRGELAGYRPGARVIRLFGSEIEEWLRRHRVKPDQHAEAIVEARLAREAATG